MGANPMTLSRFIDKVWNAADAKSRHFQEKLESAHGTWMPLHGAIWTIFELEDIMVLNNVTKFHKILIKIVDIVGVSYGCTDRQVDSGNTLSWQGHKIIARIMVKQVDQNIVSTFCTGQHSKVQV